MTFSGLTWDHPRGRDALVESARRVNAGRPAPLIVWRTQPLEGFESAPIAASAAAHDLLVLDHPHLGEAVAESCLIPLEELFSAAEIAAWAAESVGPSFRSYRFAGRHWAVPLDVATQVTARRPDRLAAAPASWDEMAAIAERLPVALSLAGPHAFLTLVSLAGSAGDVVGGDDMLGDAAALPALARMRRLADRAPAGTAALNPIALLEAMAQGDAVALVPLVFGYVTYARAGHAPHRVAFSDTPRCGIGGTGGVLGGTGIAVSARCRPSPELLDYVRDLMAPARQQGFLPAFGGQPSARSAWTSPAVNAAWGGFYRDVIDTAERALLRPRFDGFPGFTNAASARLREALDRREAEERTLAALRVLWREARGRARGNLDDDRD